MHALSAATLALPLFLGLAGMAPAGPQFLDQTGFAASGYDVVAYRTLQQAPPGQPQPQAVAGNADYTASYNGATFAFASAANRDLFLTDPARHAPKYDGHCAYGVAKGDKVPANPNLWRIVDDKLYLNITRGVVASWGQDIPGHLTLSEGNWTALEPRPASSRGIPRFRSSAPGG